MGAPADDKQFATVDVRYVTPVGEETQEIESNEFVIGRGQKADLSFVHSEISRGHFKIKVKNDLLYVEDLNSSNGTFVNGAKVEPGVDVELKSSSRVTFCPSKEYYFTFDLGENNYAKHADRIEESKLANLFSATGVKTNPDWADSTAGDSSSFTLNDKPPAQSMSISSIPTPDPKMVEMQVKMQQETEKYKELRALNVELSQTKTQLSAEVSKMQDKIKSLKIDPRLKETKEACEKDIHRLNTERSMLVDEIDKLSVQLDNLLDKLQMQTGVLQIVETESN